MLSHAAVVELERSLIVERVKGGLRNAAAKGKRLSRPKIRRQDARCHVLLTYPVYNHDPSRGVSRVRLELL